MILSDLNTGEKAVIVRVNGHGSFRKRLIEMGFINGKEVRVVLNAPLRDPIEYEIIGYKVSLRREEPSLTLREPMKSDTEYVYIRICAITNENKINFIRIS